jgi:hypothetical protein
MKSKFTSGFAAAAVVLGLAVVAVPSASAQCPAGQTTDANGYCVPAPPSSTPLVDANGDPLVFHGKSGKIPKGCVLPCQQFRNELPGPRHALIFIIRKKHGKTYHYYPRQQDTKGVFHKRQWILV